MSLVVPVPSKIFVLKMLNGSETVIEMKLHLYTNDLHVDENTSIHHLIEPSDSSYGPKDLFADQWTYSTFPPISMTYPQQLFLFNNFSDTIYGFYITSNKGKLLWINPVEPFQVTTNTVMVTPKIQII